MKMNHCIITGLFSLGMMTACVDTASSLQIEGATTQNADCSFNDPDDVRLLHGSLNLAYARPGYPLIINVTSNLSALPIEVEEVPVSGDASLNLIYLKELVLGYQVVTASGESVGIAQPAGPLLLHGTLEQDGQLLLNLLTGEAFADLVTAVPEGSTPVELLVDIQLRGKTGAGVDVESNEITFPITVGNVNNCPPGQVPNLESTDACPQFGYNGVVSACKPAPPPPAP